MRKFFIAFVAVFLTTMGAVNAQTVLNYGPGGASLLQLSTKGNGAAVQPVETDVSLTVSMSRFNSYTVTTSTAFTAVAGAAYQTTGVTPAVALPDATTCRGQTVYIQNNHGSSTTLTVSPFGSQTISGSSSATLTNGTSGEFISDGTNFFKL
jgi:hypothetical protein